MPDPADAPAAHEPPLAGMRVLEVATGIAGQYAGRLLAELAGTPWDPRRLTTRAAEDEAVPKLVTATLRPLRELRVIEMTIAWAGPCISNLLTPLGNEVIKIEARNLFDGFRTQRPYDHGMAPGLEHLVGDNRFYEAGGHFNAVNKGKHETAGQRPICPGVLQPVAQRAHLAPEPSAFRCGTTAR